MQHNRKVVVLGLAGVHGTGKTTLLKKLVEEAGERIVPVYCSTRKAFEKLGLDPKVPMGMQQRFDLQLNIHDGYVKDVNDAVDMANKAMEASGRTIMFVIADRSPLDMIAYTMAEFNQASAVQMDVELDAKFGALVNAMAEAAQSIAALHIPLELDADFFNSADEPGRAAINKSYAIHIDCLLNASGTSGVLMRPIPHGQTDLEQRTMSMMKAIDAIEHAVREDLEEPEAANA